MVTIQELYLELLDEAKRTSRTVVTRQTKIKRATSQLSTAMARKKNDPAYKMMKMYCEKCKKYRDKIHQKYAPRTRSRARR